MNERQAFCPISPGHLSASHARHAVCSTCRDSARPTARPSGSEARRASAEAERSQISWGRIDLDAQLAEEHPARAIWSVVERLNLSALYQQIEVRDQVAGASAIDPKILLVLWVYATSEGEGSAREIWRLTEVHAAYRWLCGGVEVGYHTLSDFRSQQGEVINELITQVLALLALGFAPVRVLAPSGVSQRSRHSCSRLGSTWKR